MPIPSPKPTFCASSATIRPSERAQRTPSDSSRSGWSSRRRTPVGPRRPRTPRMSAAESRNEAALAMKAASRPASPATTPPAPAPTATMTPHVDAIRTLAAPS